MRGSDWKSKLLPLLAVRWEFTATSPGEGEEKRRKQLPFPPSQVVFGLTFISLKIRVAGEGNQGSARKKRSRRAGMRISLNELAQGPGR